MTIVWPPERSRLVDGPTSGTMLTLPGRMDIQGEQRAVMVTGYIHPETNLLRVCEIHCFDWLETRAANEKRMQTEGESDA